MISKYHVLTPTSSFVYTNLFINDITASYEIPRNIYIINHRTEPVAIILNSKLEDGSDSEGIILDAEDTFTIEAMNLYQIGVKYVSAAGTGNILVSEYNFHLITK